jgi:hypothetical protein
MILYIPFEKQENLSSILSRQPEAPSTNDITVDQELDNILRETSRAVRQYASDDSTLSN